MVAIGRSHRARADIKDYEFKLVEPTVSEQGDKITSPSVLFNKQDRQAGARRCDLRYPCSTWRPKACQR